MTSSLIPEEDLQRAREKYLRENPVPPTHAEILCRIAREDPTLTVAQLADAAERSRSWVRKVLRQNGIVLIKPAKKHRVKIKASTLCGMCGHPRGGARAITFGLPSHCVPGTQHGHWSNPATYICDKRHCRAFNLVDGKAIPCGCPDFVPPQPRKRGKKKAAETQTEIELVTEEEEA